MRGLLSNYVHNFLVISRNKIWKKNWLWKKGATWVEKQKILAAFLEGPDWMASQTCA